MSEKKYKARAEIAEAKLEEVRNICQKNIEEQDNVVRFGLCKREDTEKHFLLLSIYNNILNVINSEGGKDAD